MGFVQGFKESCMSGSKMSSKRIILYTFAAVAVGMIVTEAILCYIIICKWLWGSCEGRLEFLMAFDAVVYTSVFGIIGALATVNGYENKGKKSNDKANENEYSGES